MRIFQRGEYYTLMLCDRSKVEFAKNRVPFQRRLMRFIRVSSDIMLTIQFSFYPSDAAFYKTASFS